MSNTRGRIPRKTRAAVVTVPPQGSMSGGHVDLTYSICENSTLLAVEPQPFEQMSSFTVRLKNLADGDTIVVHNRDAKHTLTLVTNEDFAIPPGTIVMFIVSGNGATHALGSAHTAAATML